MYLIMVQWLTVFGINFRFLFFKDTLSKVLNTSFNAFERNDEQFGLSARDVDRLTFHTFGFNFTVFNKYT